MQFDGAPQFRNRPVELPRGSSRHSDVDLCVERSWIERADTLGFCKGFIDASGTNQALESEAEHVDGIAAQLGRVAKLAIAFFPHPVIRVQDCAECPMRH